jgi:hypothetical protein
MFRSFDFCLPTNSTSVPTGPDWLHEVKYDGHRLRLERDGNRVRLITRGGYNWTERYPWIVESALKNRVKHFVIDGEAVVSASMVSPISTRSTRANMTPKSSSMPSTSWRWMATICAACPCRCARPIWHDYSRAGRTASLWPRLSKARSAPISSAQPAVWA